MTWAGAYPYGTPGGFEADTPIYQGTPGAPIVNTAYGHGYTAFLALNGPLTTRNPASLSDIIRTETSGGVVALAITGQENGSNVDTNVTVLDAEAGIRLYSVAPGVVAIEIPTDGLALAMIPAKLITAAKIADKTITAAQIADLTITALQIAANTITAAKIAAGTITTTEIADGTITGTDIAGTTVQEANLGSPSGVKFFAFNQLDGAAGATNVTSTTGAVIISDSIVLPNDGKRWYFEVEAGAALNAPSGQFIRIAANVNDGTTDLILTTYIGTGTVAGERWHQIKRGSSVIGSGQTLTFRLLAKVTGSTGSIGSAMVAGSAINKSFKGG